MTHIKTTYSLFTAIGLMAALLLCQAHAQSDDSAAQALSEIRADSPTSPLDCKLLYQKSRLYLKKSTSCWVDEDCGSAHFGCPWQRKGCDYTIISNSETENLQQAMGHMIFYSANCVQPNKALNARCQREKEAYDSQPYSCPKPKLKCLNGTCVPQTKVLIQNQ